MIRLTRLNGTSFMLNCELIETIEETPDTVISITTGKKLVVAETIEEIVERMIEYKKRVLLINNIE